MPLARWLAITLLGCLPGLPAVADDIRPESRPLSEARPLSDAQPMADEKCIEACDVASDECMQAAEGDSGKIQVCDDKYSECLQQCEGG
jgi:hypothetical protein